MAKGEIFHYLLEGLQDIYFQEIDDNHRLAKQLPNFDKDEEIEKRDAKIHKLRHNSIYVMSDKEKERLEAFREKHGKSCHENRVIWNIRETGVGDVIKISCHVCGEEENITDSESW